MSDIISLKHFIFEEERLIFHPNFNPSDYEIQQLILEAERNIGALARLGLKSHPLKPTILRNSLVRTAHFTTKIEQNKLKYKEVEQVYKNYKKDPLTIKQKAQLEVRNVFEAYEFIYDLDPGKYFTDMDKTILKKIQQLLMDAFSVEEYFDKRIEDYYDTLMLATQGDLKPFIIFYLECVISSLTKVLNELLRFDRIKHIREVLGKGHAKTMFELIARMEDGEAFHRQLFDETLDSSSSSIAKNLSKLKELDVIKHGDERGEYIVSIVE